MAKKEVIDKSNPAKIKWIKISVISLVIIAFAFLIFFIFSNNGCGDGTLNKECSDKKPYFCQDGNLIINPSVCSCPETLILKNGNCVSDYTTQSESRTFDYILRGKKDKIDFIVYKDFADYLPSVDKLSEGDSRREFKLNIINNEEQRDLLLPLVVKIQNKTSDKTDQMRIAVSLVQNILYIPSEENTIFGYKKIPYHRYPYEVLYDEKGICGEKTDLLAFLLKELGYGVAIFYYPSEDHEVVGIKCNDKYDLDNTGYCFVETTGPSIISNSQGYYIGWGKLSSEPEVIPISDGISLSRNLYEFGDAQSWIKLNEMLDEKGELNFFRYYKWKKIKGKYGL